MSEQIKYARLTLKRTDQNDNRKEVENTYEMKEMQEADTQEAQQSKPINGILLLQISRKWFLEVVVPQFKANKFFCIFVIAVLAIALACVFFFTKQS